MNGEGCLGATAAMEAKGSVEVETACGPGGPAEDVKGE